MVILLIPMLETADSVEAAQGGQKLVLDCGERERNATGGPV